MYPDHLSSKLNHTPGDIDEFIINHLYEHAPSTMILNSISQTLNTTFPEGVLYKYRNKVLYIMLDDTKKHRIELPLIN